MQRASERALYLFFLDGVAAAAAPENCLSSTRPPIHQTIALARSLLPSFLPGLDGAGDVKDCVALNQSEKPASQSFQFLPVLASAVASCNHLCVLRNCKYCIL